MSNIFFSFRDSFPPNQNFQINVTYVRGQCLMNRGNWGKADYLRNSMQYLFTECLYLTKDFSIG